MRNGATTDDEQTIESQRGRRSRDPIRQLALLLDAGTDPNANNQHHLARITAHLTALCTGLQEKPNADATVFFTDATLSFEAARSIHGIRLRDTDGGTNRATDTSTL